MIFFLLHHVTICGQRAKKQSHYGRCFEKLKYSGTIPQPIYKKKI